MISAYNIDPKLAIGELCRGIYHDERVSMNIVVGDITIRAVSTNTIDKIAYRYGWKKILNKRLVGLRLIDIEKSDLFVKLIFECDYSLIITGTEYISLFVRQIVGYTEKYRTALHNLLRKYKYHIDDIIYCYDNCHEFAVDGYHKTYYVYLLDDSYYRIYDRDTKSSYICDNLHELIETLNFLEENARK